MHPLVNKVARFALDALLPETCLLCQLPSRRSLPLCAGCAGELSPNAHGCARCALPLSMPTTEGAALPPRLCGHCLRRPPAFAQVTAPWRYDELIAHLVQRWKYGRERRLTRLFAALWCEAVPAPSAIDLLVPVPLHWQRLWQRGFNQADLFARALRMQHPALRSVPVASTLVRRRRPTAVQAQLSRAARRANLRAAFTVLRPCDNLRVAIVDDVLTTGATADRMAAALIDAGAARVEVWCLARTPAPGG